MVLWLLLAQGRVFNKCKITEPKLVSHSAGGSYPVT